MRVIRLLLLLAVVAPAAAQTEPVRIVVIGSSNAAGTGPSVQDSAWVDRLRAHLDQVRPGSSVVNLARGGYLTYHLMPTGFVPPAGLQTPDSNRNITAALDADPDAVVISLTSNDADLGYAPVDQLARYDAMVDAAGDVPVFITTTTPRSFWRNNGAGTRAEKRAIQAVLKDSTLARYGDRAIDFWTTLAAPDSTPAAPTSAGDGVHFNDAGHRIFFERVLASDLVSAAVATPAEAAPTSEGLGLRAVPNPSPQTIEAQTPGGSVRLTLFDALGRRVATLLDGDGPGGVRHVPIGRLGLAPGLYLLRLDHDGRSRTATMTVAR